MINPEDLKQEVSMFKNGHSYAFRVSKKDREFLKADETTKFEKIVSPDGRQITFRKVERSHPDVLKAASKLYDQHKDLMKRLENL